MRIWSKLAAAVIRARYASPPRLADPLESPHTTKVTDVRVEFDHDTLEWLVVEHCGYNKSVIGRFGTNTEAHQLRADRLRGAYLSSEDRA